MSRRKTVNKHLLPKQEFLRIILVTLQMQINDLVLFLPNAFRLNDSNVKIQRALTERAELLGMDVREEVLG